MDWTLFWQIAGPIAVIVSIVISIALFIIPRREKTEIRDANMLAELRLTIDKKAFINLEYSFALVRIKGTRNQYVSQVYVKLNKRLRNELKQYFEIPLTFGGVPVLSSDGLGHSPGDATKLEPGKPLRFGDTLNFMASRTLTKKERKEADDLVQKLWHQYRIGWKDTYRKRVHWKTINQSREVQKILKSKP
ncbi:hypothetical protein ES708_33472 [subsurface metagenome]